MLSRSSFAYLFWKILQSASICQLITYSARISLPYFKTLSFYLFNFYLPLVCVYQSDISKNTVNINILISKGSYIRPTCCLFAHGRLPRIPRRNGDLPSVLSLKNSHYRIKIQTYIFCIWGNNIY